MRRRGGEEEKEAGGSMMPPRSPAPLPWSCGRAPCLCRRAGVSTVHLTLYLFDESLLEHHRDRDTSLLPYYAGDALTADPCS
jgi:hypothetical protein